MLAVRERDVIDNWKKEKRVSVGDVLTPRASNEKDKSTLVCVNLGKSETSVSQNMNIPCLH